MRYLKKFNENTSSLEELCKIYIDGHRYNKEKIDKGELSYEIVDGYVNVTGQLSLDLYNIDTIPIKLGKVSDTIFISGDITSLKNSPRSVGYAFNIMSCGKLTSLEGGPEYIGTWYHTGSIPLNSLYDIAKPLNEKYKLSFSKSYSSMANIIKLFIEPTERYSNEFIINYDTHILIELFNEYDPVRENNTVVLDRLNDFLKVIGKNTVDEVYGYTTI